MCLRITNVRIRAEVLKRSTQILGMFPPDFLLDLLGLLSTFLPVCHLVLKKSVVLIYLVLKGDTCKCLFRFKLKNGSIFKKSIQCLLCT